MYGIGLWVLMYSTVMRKAAMWKHVTVAMKEVHYCTHCSCGGNTSLLLQDEQKLCRNNVI